MAKSNLGKVILLLVEGHSDATTLVLSLSSVVENNHEVCMLSEPYNVDTIESGIGDVTSKIDNNHTVVERVGNAVKSFIDYKRSHGQKITIHDIAGVIHVMDTDGTFIPEECLFGDADDPDAGFVYEEDGIHGPNKGVIIRRNVMKSKDMITLCNLKRVCAIPYKAYFMSCNLDHVTCKERNLDDNIKEDAADEFHAKYKRDLPGFIDFFNQSDLSLGSNYRESWKLIQTGMNSINRHSNLHLFINDPFGQLAIDKKDKNVE